jgi:hypothetical protein
MQVFALANALYAHSAHPDKVNGDKSDSDPGVSRMRQIGKKNVRHKNLIRDCRLSGFIPNLFSMIIDKVKKIRQGILVQPKRRLLTKLPSNKCRQASNEPLPPACGLFA